MTDELAGKGLAAVEGEQDLAAAGTATPPSLLVFLRGSRRPLVLEVRKKKRRRYSRPLKQAQKSMEASARVGDRAFAALSAGAHKYRRRAAASARKKRDGVLKDLWKNSASALSAVLRKSSKLPRELARAALAAHGSPAVTLRRRARALRWLGGIG